MTFLNGTKIELRKNVSSVSSGLLSQFNFESDHKSLKIRSDTQEHTLWCHMVPTGVPTYNHEMINDVRLMQRNVTQFFSNMAHGQQHPLRWFVMASAIPGIFNLGGDLAHFADRIRHKDLNALRHYGHVAVEAIYRNTVAFDAPLITMALVQGDALGGGFEHALSFDLIVAERSAKLGLPEILFNMFPGMGAYSFLSRRLDRARAEALILSGRVHTAAELYAMGIVDVLAEDGEGELAVREYIARHDPKHNAHLGMYRSRRRVNPVSLSELRDVVDIWAEAAMNLSDTNLRTMDRLSRAQTRRVAAKCEATA